MEPSPRDRRPIPFAPLTLAFPRCFATGGVSIPELDSPILNLQLVVNCSAV